MTRQAATALLFVFTLLMIFAAYMLSSMAIVQRYAVLDVVEGSAQVLVHGEGEPAPCKAGELVRVGDVLQTGPDSSVELRWLRWAGGMRLKVGPESRFTIVRAIVNKSDEREESRLRLDEGRIWIRLRKALTGRSKFEVETPTVVAAVRGTVFGVTVAEDGTSTVEVYDGHVAVAGVDGATATVTGGGHTTVRREQRGCATLPMDHAHLAQWEAQSSIVGPFLEVTSPSEGASAGADSIPVTGRTERGLDVSINGAAVEISSKGEFTQEIHLAGGTNAIVVTARDREGRETVITRTVLRESGAPAE